MTEFEKECIRWYGRKLTGNYAHYCPDWDYLPIDDTVWSFNLALARSHQWMKMNPMVKEDE